eukprot:3367158-Pleurochrysis_carterae.AAC.1
MPARAPLTERTELSQTRQLFHYIAYVRPSAEACFSRTLAPVRFLSSLSCFLVARTAIALELWSETSFAVCAVRYCEQCCRSLPLRPATFLNASAFCAILRCSSSLFFDVLFLTLLSYSVRPDHDPDRASAQAEGRVGARPVPGVRSE